MTPAAPTAADTGITIFAQVAALAALWLDRGLAVLTQRQEDIHWVVATGAGVLAGVAALLAIYRHVRAILARRRRD